MITHHQFVCSEPSSGRVNQPVLAQQPVTVILPLNYDYHITPPTPILHPVVIFLLVIVYTCSYKARSEPE